MERSAHGANGMRQRTVPTECVGGKGNQNVSTTVGARWQSEEAVDGKVDDDNGNEKGGAADAEDAKKEDL